MSNLLYIATVNAQIDALLGSFWAAVAYVGVGFLLGAIVCVPLTILVMTWREMRFQLHFTDTDFEHRYPTKSRWTSEGGYQPKPPPKKP